MAQPTSGDDYYAKIETSTTQSDMGTEKKKIKIVAKKIVPQPQAQPQPVNEEKPVNDECNPSDAVLDTPEPVYAPRSVKLPEGGKLDL